MKKFWIAFLLGVSALWADNSWVSVNIVDDIHMDFPSAPNQMIHQVPLVNGKQMDYVIYLCEEDDALFMALIGKYPMNVDKNDEMKGLKGFLQGILSGRQNRLIRADVVSYKGKNAIAFEMVSDDKKFLGRAFIYQSKIFLLAEQSTMSREYSNYYERFLESFREVKE